LTAVRSLSKVEFQTVIRKLAIAGKAGTVQPAGVCCERCPGATLANTRHIARRRLLKAAVFQPQQAGMGLVPGSRGGTKLPGSDGPHGKTGSPGEGGAVRRTGGIALGSRADGGSPHGNDTDSHRSAPAEPGTGTPPAPANLYRAVTGQIIDVSPQVIAIGDEGGERRFALTASATAWRGSSLDPASLSRGDEAVIRLLPSRPGVADRIWANIGRVTGIIVDCDSASILVNEGATKSVQKVVIPRNASGRVQVKLPNMRPGYLIDIIGIRHPDYLEGMIPVNPQPPYHSDRVVPDRTASGRLSESIAGSAIWHDSAEEPYGVLGVSYPAIDPAAACAEDTASRFPPGRGPAFRQLPYLAVGTALNVRNECADIAWTLPVTGCAPMARLFNDRCVACAASPRGRVADLTLASFVALGGDLEAGCFSTTLTIGR
jgi:hypothetical protein